MSRVDALDLVKPDLLDLAQSQQLDEELFGLESAVPKAYPMKDMTTRTIAETFLREYISRLGIPSQLTTDRGTQFESRMMEKLNKLLGIQRIRTTAYPNIFS